MSNYQHITKFQRIISLSEESIHSEYELNFNLQVSFNIDLILNPILDVKKDALAFQQPKCPNNLQMNHGEYINKNGNGIQNVIKELKAKHTSNRAIISLINQNDIVGSGDNPIPSFMILQFSIENSNELYVTTYFRALEVSKFLRINIEEIRMIIQQIQEEIIDITKVNLNIIAFRAYIKKDINPLKRAKLDLLSQIKILGLLRKHKDKKELLSLLEEKKASSTIIEYNSFEMILECLNDEDSETDINSDINQPLIKSKFEELIKISKELKDLRTKSSHSPQINEKQEIYITLIDEIIREIRHDS